MEMLQTFLESKLSDLGGPDMWFQQDRSTAHTVRRLMEVLREILPEHLISLPGDIGWLARSPDLDPCYFFSLDLLETCGLHQPMNN